MIKENLLLLLLLLDTGKLWVVPLLRPIIYIGLIYI